MDPVSLSGSSGHRNSRSRDIYDVGRETRKKIGSQTGFYRLTWGSFASLLAMMVEVTVGGSVFGG